jgi:hypothetical protein
LTDSPFLQAEITFKVARSEKAGKLLNLPVSFAV